MAPIQYMAKNKQPTWRQRTKLTAQVNNQKHTFLYKNELTLPQIFSTLQKNILRLLLNVIYVEWMHRDFEACVLITSVSICSSSLTVIFKSRDRAGQVVPKFFLLVFNSRQN